VVPPIDRAAGPCTGCAADGWTVDNLTPDVVNGDGASPESGFTISDVDGTGNGVMQLLLSDAVAGNESITTTVTGMTPGVPYYVDVQLQSCTLTDATHEYIAGSVSATIAAHYNTEDTVEDDGWTNLRVGFTATSDSETLVVSAETGGTGADGGCVVVDNYVVIPGSCGNSRVNVGEVCDDGNTDDGDGCSSTCTVEDGFTCTTDEPNVCTTTCGDGIIAGAEACDDTNAAGGDGCSASCAVETGYSCSGEPSTCAPNCSNGTVDAFETCDDGNTLDGDGCSATCAAEDGGSNGDTDDPDDGGGGGCPTTHGGGSLAQRVFAGLAVTRRRRGR
jgi:cysteine-rich repeat protein